MVLAGASSMIKVSQYVENQAFVTILQLLFILIHDKILYYHCYNKHNYGKFGFFLICSIC